MVKGKYLYYGDDLKDAFNIRKKVFHDENNIEEELLFDEYDNESIHAIVYNENQKVVASGRIMFDGENYKLGRIAVLKEERGKMYGDFLVRMLVDKAFITGAEQVIVSAIENAIPFYKKIGFIESGDKYIEEDTPHQLMILKQNDLCKECNKH